MLRIPRISRISTTNTLLRVQLGGGSKSSKPKQSHGRRTESQQQPQIAQISHIGFVKSVQSVAALFWALILSIFQFYWQVPETLWIEVTISSFVPFEDDSFMDDLLPDEDVLEFDEGEEELEVASLPVIRTLCPTQF